MMTRLEIDDIFKSFENLKALVIGDVMVDSYIWGNVNRLSPEAPVPIVNVTKRDNRPGGAANVAVNIQALGAEPILCSLIGKDEKGELFTQLLKDYGLPVHGIIKSDERITTVKFRIIGNNSHLLRVDEETEKKATLSETDTLLKTIKDVTNKESIDVIIFEDYDKGVITEELIKEVVIIAKSKNIPVVVDPKKKNFRSYTGVSLFKPNFSELCQGLKIESKPSEIEQMKSLIFDFQKEQNIKILLLSMSEHGVFVSEMSTSNEFTTTQIPAHLRNIADVSGAGDTLIAVASLCIALNINPKTTAQLANLAGGVVCEYVGAVPINKQKMYNEALKIWSLS
ncbi:MAG: bifunctional ADP-heptose synthase [Bacteroidales bacterium]|nr:bifunctional ADP-heptose synthase [Bacteroidales bacterium]